MCAHPELSSRRMGGWSAVSSGVTSLHPSGFLSQPHCCQLSERRTGGEALGDGAREHRPVPGNGRPTASHRTFQRLSIQQGATYHQDGVEPRLEPDMFLVLVSSLLQGFKTKDGHIIVAAGNNQQFVNVCQVRHTSALRPLTSQHPLVRVPGLSGSRGIRRVNRKAEACLISDPGAAADGAHRGPQVQNQQAACPEPETTAAHSVTEVGALMGR